MWKREKGRRRRREEDRGILRERKVIYDPIKGSEGESGNFPSSLRSNQRHWGTTAGRSAPMDENALISIQLARKCRPTGLRSWDIYYQTRPSSHQVWKCSLVFLNIVSPCPSYSGGSKRCPASRSGWWWQSFPCSILSRTSLAGDGLVKEAESRLKFLWKDFIGVQTPDVLAKYLEERESTLLDMYV